MTSGGQRKIIGSWFQHLVFWSYLKTMCKIRLFDAAFLQKGTGAVFTFQDSCGIFTNESHGGQTFVLLVIKGFAHFKPIFILNATAIQSRLICINFFVNYRSFQTHQGAHR